MSVNPGKLSRFWQELKRRRVIHVITVYASSAFVIIELINNLAEPLNLPPNLLTIVLIILAVGFPLAIILSWLYDLTGQGMERTKPLSEIEEGEKTVVPNAWKIATYISFALILGLVAFNIISSTKKLHPGDIQSLVVLPFENYTGDDQLDNMVSSMHALLIGDIGQISGLKIKGITTSNIYKGTNKSAKEIAKELNVDGVVETTMMCLGDTVCMQVSLVSTNGDEYQLWSADYNEDKRQILNLFNRIIKKIAQEVKVQLTPEEERLLSKSRTVDREAYDAFLKSSYLLDDGSEESLYKALEYLNSAIEKDPDWAPPYSGLILVWLTLAQGYSVSPEIADPKIIAYRNKALELDPDFADIHKMDAGIAFLTEWNWEKAEKEFLKGLAINPNNAGLRIAYAGLLACLQRPSEALTQGQLAIELEPLDLNMKVFYGVVLSGIGDFKTALAYGEKVTAVDPRHLVANSSIEHTAFLCGDYNKVMKAAKIVLAQREVDFKEVERIFGETGFVAAYEEILRQLEVLAQKGYYPPPYMAARYMMVDQPDKAMEWIEKGFEVHDQNMVSIATKGLFEPLFDNPRFIEILQKMNLPLPTAN